MSFHCLSSCIHAQEQWDPTENLCNFAFLQIVVLGSSFLFALKIHISCGCSLSTGVGPASVMVGNLVAGKRIAQASGRDLGQIEDNDLVKKVNQCLL